MNENTSHQNHFDTIHLSAIHYNEQKQKIKEYWSEKDGILFGTIDYDPTTGHRTKETLFHPNGTIKSVYHF
ncbi:DUF2963 domain-containing protein [Candidatus Phytoplasma pruni]|uniref:DUF2963 domain-containing protein n=1 Tax=Candidatus Phytoplasma pruni TaxID=479893 RepID=A0A851HIR3_9MOLU|nr:hypothetical protein [Candidatus Phytoplasma pruni]NWN45713.1 hypothetical protein [Candidatus Phytoplasma pruni]